MFAHKFGEIIVLLTTCKIIRNGQFIVAVFCQVFGDVESDKSGSAEEEYFLRHAYCLLLSIISLLLNEH